MKKTVIVFSNFQTLPTFHLVEGDYSHLNYVVINAGHEDEQYMEQGDLEAEKLLEEELKNLLYDNDSKSKYSALDLDELREAMLNPENTVINCGFCHE